MKCPVGRKNSAALSGIRIANDDCLRAARCITVSRGDQSGWFSVYIENHHGEVLRVSTDLPFRTADQLKERYLKRRQELNQNHARKRA